LNGIPNLNVLDGCWIEERYRIGDFFGHVDLGIHLAFKRRSAKRE